MKKFYGLILFILALAAAAAAAAAAAHAQQTGADLEKLVETEKAFARAAEAKGTKAAFLEFLADDGIVFSPTAANGKEVWKNRPESPALLAWNPTFADISANGAVGYTTGDWSFHPKGKTDAAAAFGQYFTIWQKQADGNFKAVLDLGISHPKPASVETGWKSPPPPPAAAGGTDSRKPSATAAAQSFFEAAETRGLARAYQAAAAEDLRLLREGAYPFVGKKIALKRVEKEKGAAVKFSKRMFFVGAGDLAYLSDAYTLTRDGGKTTVKGNLAQIWKLRGGVWQLVLDIWNEIPPERKQ